MSGDRSPELRTLALMGACLLHVQLAERVLAGAVKSVLGDRTLTAAKLMEQTEHEWRHTLGDMLKELRRRARIERKFRDKLYRFLEMRNIFVHDVSEVPGWNLSTEQGRKVATDFLFELFALSLSVTG